jgi:hypothetical protein
VGDALKGAKRGFYHRGIEGDDLAKGVKGGMIYIKSTCCNMIRYTLRPWRVYMIGDAVTVILHTLDVLSIESN